MNEASRSDRLIGRTLGDFVVQVKIGEGGFGMVYLAEQRLLRRDAVIKVLRRSHRSDETVIQRFLREAQLASALDHPYAAHIYAFGAEPDGLLWIAMERVRGTPLDQMLKATGPLPIERFVPLFQRICEVVQSAHERSIVHRDLKPANVMVLSRSGLLLPKLLDFGIAKHLGDADSDELGVGLEVSTDTAAALGEAAAEEGATIDRKITGEGAVLGSPHYMAPEQWVNKGVGPHTDLYALGVLAYETLTGRVPFDGRDALAVARGHAKKAVPPLGSGFPPALDAVLARAMAKRPTARFAHALDFAAEVHAASGLSAEPLGLPQLDEPVREALLVSAPQPLAEAVAALDAVRSIHQARDAAWQVFRVATHLVALYALAARSRAAVGDEGDAAAELLRTLRRRGLSDREWLALTRALVAPYAARRETHAIPELVGLFFDGDGAPLADDPLGALTELREAGEAAAKEDEVRQHLGRVVPMLSSALRRLAFLGGYRVVAVQGGVAEAWMGVRRPRRASLSLRGPKLEDGAVALIAEDGTPILLLSPLVQVAAPSPGAPAELFLFEGPGRRGARLLSLPTAFEHTDEALWDWYRAALDASSDDVARGAAQAERAPYVGLNAFSSADADLFFGRDRDVETALNRLRAATFLAVVGPSGAGKSSFVHAGVAAALPAGSQVIALRPGAQPFAALAARLQRAAPQSHLDAALLAASPDALAAALATLPAAPGAWTVLVVDQFEELFTLATDEGERARFAEAVVRAARSPDAPVRVVLTLRDDFLMRTQEIAPLREALAAGLQLLATPAPDELRRIVVEPARRVGYELDDAKLADEIVAQVRHLPAALPLVSFTALRLWELRDRHFRQLTRKAYASMGGVGGALARHAEDMLAQLGPEEQRLVREAFRHLVTAEGTRAVLTRAELAQVLAGGARAEAVIDRLVESRLVVASEAERGAAQIEIAHEALISAWPRLVAWRSEDAEGARLRDQLRAAVRQWSERQRPRGLLWRDEALAEYELWRARHPQPLTEAEEAFARASQTQARAGKRLRRRLLVGAFAVLAIGLFVLFRSDRRSRLNAAEAQRRLATFHASQGRQRLLENDPLRALLYLGEAARLGLDDLDLRLLIGQARQALEPLRRVLRGHTGEVWNAYYSRDGKRLLTFGPDGTARLFDADSGAAHGVLAQPGMVEATLAPDARRVITRDDTTAQVWDTVTGRVAYSIDGLGRSPDVTLPPTRPLFSDDGRLVVTAGADHAVHVRRAADGVELHVLRGHTATINSLAPAGPGQVLSVGDHTVRLWDVRSGRLLHTITAAGLADLRFAALNAEGTRLLIGGTPNAQVRDLRTGSLLLTFPQVYRAIAGEFGANDAFAVLGEGETSVQLWAKDGHPIAALPTHSACKWLEFSPDGKRILTAGTDGMTRVWDATSGAALVVLAGHTGRVWHAHWSPDGTQIASASADRTARTWQPIPPGLERALDHPSKLYDAQFSADGARILTSSVDQTLRTWDARTGRLLASLRPANVRAGDYALWANGGAAAIAFGGLDVSVWRPDGSRVAGPLHHASTVSWAALSPDGGRVAAGGDDGNITLWRVADGQLERVLRGHTQEIVHLAFDPSGRLLGSASEDQTARVWTLDGSAAPVVLTGHGARVESVAFSPDGASVLTAGVDQTLRLWRASNGDALAQLSGHTSEIMMARFSHDGQLIASAGQDGRRVWSVATGQQLYARDGQAIGITFSADDQALLVAGDTTASRWALPGRDHPANDLIAGLRCLVPFRFVGDNVLPAPLPADCAD